MTLAIVDDDAGVRRALARLLRSLGHDVHVFESAEAFEAEAVAVDCVIVDVRAAWSQRPRTARTAAQHLTPTPVVLITGDSDPMAENISSAIDSPCVQPEPFNEITLIAAIAHAVSSADALRERHAD